MNKWIFILCLFILGSCAKEYGYDVDPELQSYFQLFEQEAEARGQSVDLEAAGIGGIIEFIMDNSTVGQCQTSDEGNKRVFIDKAFWEDYDNLEKEFIVFHELGHCYLLREHDNSTNFNNTCKSIMQSGVSGCKNNYKQSTRKEYLDELFNN